jgi:hypothetical protein
MFRSLHLTGAIHPPQQFILHSHVVPVSFAHVHVYRLGLCAFLRPSGGG